MDPAFVASALALGLGAGFLSGLFGVGGGVLMVPALLLLVPGTDFYEAKAVSLVVISLATLAGILRHRAAGNVDLRLGLLLAAGGLLGSAVGTALSVSVPERTLEAAFGLFLVLIGSRLATPAEPAKRDLSARGRTLLFAAVGLLGGLLSGFFGVGGGLVMVPVMALAGVGMHVAVGTSLVAVLANALAATATNVGLGYTDVLVAVGPPVALGSLLGISAGVATANRLHATRLRRIFGAGIVVMGLGMLVRAGLG